MSRHIFVLAALLALSGTATVAAKEKPKPLFVQSVDQSLQPPPADKAQIIFLEPINSIQGLFPVGVFEVEGDNRTLLATTGAHSKAVVLVTPGHHIFMANHSGMIAHFLDANVEPGKRYYVLLRFIYAHGFQLRPIRPSGASDYSVANKKFPAWISETHFVDKTSESDVFFEKINATVVKSQAAGWTDWLAKSPSERAELTLIPQDAISL
jgi:hypothetical protein